MYELKKDGRLYGYEDYARYVKLQTNGVYVLCPADEAQGVVVNNDYVAHLEGKPELPGTETVSIREFNGPAKLAAITAEGAALAQASTAEPAATVGVLVDGFPKWEPGAYYEKRYTLFEHKGDVYFTRQPNITAYAHQEPGTTGMESVYGIRPVPDDVGIFPYRYNMAASVGMKVREADTVYECYQAVDPMLWPPSQLPAHFTTWEP